MSEALLTRERSRPRAERLAVLLRSFRFRFQNETELQDGIARVFTEEKVSFKREHSLSRWDRPDFLVGAVAIEVKIAGTLSNLLRQLSRYTEFEEVSCLIVVTNLSRLAQLPATLNGKSLRVVLLRTGL